MKTPEQMAEDHWEYTKKIINIVGELLYKEAFIHGMKHKMEEKENDKL